MNNATEPTSADTTTDSVAIIGLAGRFPGADDAPTFWKNLAAGLSGVTDVPEGHNPNSSLPSHPNYVPRAAVVKDADFFDAQFFGIYPKQAVDMDPQHRLFLEMAWHAMENAGYVPDAAPGRVGVFAGCHMNTYIFTRLAADAEFRESLADSYPGGSLTAEISNDKDYLATRVAYQLNLRGPSVAVQSACSTSLVAISQACENLMARSCDMAISGGVTVTFPQQQGYLHTEDSILSPDGSCRTFDADACGTIFGDGVGAVVLKRLSDAIADRDDIYAVIRGWGVNNDGGDKMGYTAPSVSGQSTAIKLAHRRAGITADTISYVEAHGTGTLVGDPIEVNALTEAFRETTDKKQFCRIGSLKTNVGHLDVAAGVSSVIKTSLSLRHRQIPPMLHFKSPNPKIDFANSPFIINDKLTDWESPTGPRRAGVSAFGVGGTNAHLVIEEAPASESLASPRPCHLIRLSARSLAALDQMSDDLAQHLADNNDLNLADVSHTLQVGRKTFRHKRVVVASDLPEAVELLRSRSPKQAPTVDNRATATPIAFLFPGQGSQHIDMARALYETEPVFAEHLDACAECLTPHLDLDLRTLVFPAADAPPTDRLDQTEIAQPALFMISWALGKWWQSLGVQPTTLIGHSVGEFAAAALAGVMSMEDAARLVALRGRLMQSLPAGSMMAVQLSEERLQPLLPESLEIAAINGPAFCVISGPSEAVTAFAAEIEAGRHGEGIACRTLRTSHAFHSRMMDAAIEPFEQEVRKIELHPPTIPIVSSVTALPMDAATATDPVYWARQIREPVRFSDALAALIAQHSGDLVLLEVGPNQALSTLARQQPLDTNRQHVLSSLPHVSQAATDARFTVTTIGRLWQQGVTLDWTKVYAGELRSRLHLPMYRFERQRYSFETDLQRGKTDREQNPAASTEKPATSAPEPQPQPAPQPAVEVAAEPPVAQQAATTVPQQPLPTHTTSVAQTVIQQQMQLMNQQMTLLNQIRRT
ncbi:Phthiocerol synthesis polyketide synthase type I PpsE [Rosistilla oblonga]|uniref:type I polyketide synthase n=1 Tax=Rosistilla oblonga TaxID=2527990 RepID=UPI0011882CA1|nr:type I polyketide synthase [Rosistilla oblonga]QDV10930.1 Phthiocerol synthesis polyketide synthase type I PpsE [Rosistilla oblonga]